MKSYFLLFTAVASIGLSAAQANIDRVTEKTFTVPAAGSLSIDTQGGNVTVAIGSDDAVHVVAKKHFKTNTESEADVFDKNLKLEITQNADAVSAVAKYMGSRSTSPSGHGWFGGWSIWPPVQVDFVVTVPRHYSAHLRTSGGNIEVGDLSAKIDVATSGGNISVGAIDADAKIETSGGNIEVKSARGSLLADTSGGHIGVGQFDGKARLTTSGGNVEIESISGSLFAESSGGNVSAHFSAAPNEDTELRTSGGNVRVRLPRSSAFNLDASTAGGNVQVSDLTIEIKHGGNGKSDISGPVNGGGVRLTLRTSGGNVRVSGE